MQQFFPPNLTPYGIVPAAVGVYLGTAGPWDKDRTDESIRVHDKLLLILSETSLNSQWIEQEVETALEKEREQNRTVLFPIRIDGAVMGIKGGWPFLIRNTRNIGDFSNRKDHDTYQKALGRLLRDLKAEEKALE